MKQQQKASKGMKQQQQQQKDEMKMTSLINLLPDDVLINKILRKLDTKSLGKLRCVCKYLRSFISSPDFVKMHWNDQFNNNPLVLIYYCKKNLLFSLNFNDIQIDPSLPPETVEIVSPFFPTLEFFGSCNGLLCLVESQYPPSLWNPTTKEHKELPPPLPHSSTDETRFGRSNADKRFFRSSYVAYGFGYDRIINDYKVIQCENFSQYGHCLRNNKDDDYSSSKSTH